MGDVLGDFTRGFGDLLLFLDRFFNIPPSAFRFRGGDVGLGLLLQRLANSLGKAHGLGRRGASGGLFLRGLRLGDLFTGVLDGLSLLRDGLQGVGQCVFAIPIDRPVVAHLLLGELSGGLSQILHHVFLLRHRLLWIRSE